MNDPTENLLLTLVTTNLDFRAIQLNYFLGKYSTGKNIQRLQKDIDFFQLIWSDVGKTNGKGVEWTNLKSHRLMHRVTIAPHTRALFSGLLLTKMKDACWNSEITHLSAMQFQDLEKKVTAGRRKLPKAFSKPKSKTVLMQVSKCSENPPWCSKCE